MIDETTPNLEQTAQEARPQEHDAHASEPVAQSPEEQSAMVDETLREEPTLAGALTIAMRLVPLSLFRDQPDIYLSEQAAKKFADVAAYVVRRRLGLE